MLETDVGDRCEKAMLETDVGDRSWKPMLETDVGDEFRVVQHPKYVTNLCHQHQCSLCCVNFIFLVLLL